MSSSTRSGESSRVSRNPCSAFSAARTRKSGLCSTSRMVKRIPASSSITKMVAIPNYPPDNDIFQVALWTCDEKDLHYCGNCRLMGNNERQRHFEHRPTRNLRVHV